MSSSSTPRQQPEDPLKKTYAVSRRFLERQEEIWALEEKLQRLKANQNRDLERYPYLGNIVGLVRKAAAPGDKKEAQKKRKAEDESMEGVTSTASKTSTPHERLAKKLAQNKSKEQQAEKAHAAELLKGAAHDKF